MTQTIEQLQAKVAELEAEVGWLKTVRMKYRRMAFNAQLQDENNELRTQLAAAQEEIESNKAYFATLLEEQRVQLATAEQRVAEACAEVALERRNYRASINTMYALEDVANEIRHRQWRKFVKEA